MDGKTIYGDKAIQIGVIVFGDCNQWYVDEARRKEFGIVFGNGYAEVWKY